MAAERHEVAFIVGAIAGSVAGAVYGLLNAPQAGWRTRADLSGFLEALGDRAAARASTTMLEIQAAREGGLEPDVGEPWPTSFGGLAPDAATTARTQDTDQTTSQFGREGGVGQ